MMPRHAEQTVGELLEALRQRRSRLLDLVGQIDAELGNEGQSNGKLMRGNKPGGRGNGKSSGRTGGALAAKGALLAALKQAPGGLTKEELKTAVPGADLRALRFEASVKKKGNRYVLA